MGFWEDHEFQIGDRGYNHYDLHWGNVIENPDDAGWFSVMQDDGTKKYLNDERFVTSHRAKGFPFSVTDPQN